MSLGWEMSVNTGLRPNPKVMWSPQCFSATVLRGDLVGWRGIRYSGIRRTRKVCGQLGGQPPSQTAVRSAVSPRVCCLRHDHCGVSVCHGLVGLNWQVKKWLDILCVVSFYLFICFEFYIICLFISIYFIIQFLTDHVSISSHAVNKFR